MPKRIQIGAIAYRDPETGEFLPIKPLYKAEASELQKQEELLQKTFKKLILAGLIEYLNKTHT